MCVTNLCPALVSLLSHHFSVSLTTVAMIQSRPTSAEGDGLPCYMVDVVLMPLVYSRTSTREWSEWMAVSCLRCPCDSFGFHSVWLRPVNYCVLSTPNTEGAMDENPSCCDCVSLFACVCRYSSVRAGGWFYIYVVQCLLISQWAICLIFSSSLFTQRDSQPTAFPLPLATLRMLACTLV